MVYENSLKKIIYIAGPTASGKTDLAISLCKCLGGEIIGADSMQIYKSIEIGTAKPTQNEIGDCVYSFIDFVQPSEIYTVSQYKDEALNQINRIHKSGQIPIVCGGTGLYINSLLYEMDFTSASFDLDFRKSLENKTRDELLYILKTLDENTYKEIDKYNLRRVQRAIEICHLSGKEKSAQIWDYKAHPRKFDHRVFILSPPREILYDRINKRVDVMINSGIVEEVKGLVEKYQDTSYPIFQYIGYKEIMAFLNGEINLDTATERIKRNTRRFAKRQLTWFRGITGIENLHWLDTQVGKDELLQQILKLSN